MAGIYNATIEYLSDEDSKPLLFDINSQENGNIYVLQETYSEIAKEDFTMELIEGVNSIKFYGDKNDDCPDLGVVTFQLIQAF